MDRPGRNYPDLERGQQVEFAVEFSFAREPELGTDTDPSNRHLHGTSYEIAGRVVARGGEAWALDCGIGVFQEATPPAGVEVGDFVRGIVNLGVDPFFYFERLHAMREMPPLIYTWRIDSISRDAAPFVRSGNVHVRDATKPGWIPLERTDAWHDDGGQASYRLDLVRLDVPPKRTSRTAT